MRELITEELPAEHTVSLDAEGIFHLFSSFDLYAWNDLLGAVQEPTLDEETEALIDDAKRFCETIGLDEKYAPTLAVMFIESLENSPDVVGLSED